MVFVFGTLAEFAFVLFLNQFFGHMAQASNESTNGMKKEKKEALFVNRRNKEFKEAKVKVKAMNKWDMISDGVAFARKIDLISFLAFNFSYLIFNIVYWISY